MLVLESVINKDMDEVIEKWLLENVGRRQYDKNNWKHGEWRLVRSHFHYDEKNDDNRNSVEIAFKHDTDSILFRMMWYSGLEVFEDES